MVQVAWRAIIYGSPVLAADGTTVGTVREVLGSDQEDVFHGIRLAPEHIDHDVVIPADRVTSITRATIGTNLTPLEVSGLPEFDDVATFHLASVGWLRKHLGWVRDSEADEEPG
jgi:sporulation protein YlmC with PRC-barrel domain